jgi:hypothetical protein
MKRTSSLFVLALATVGVLACGGSVDVGSIATSDAGTPGVDPVSGRPCAQLHGTVTLGDRITHGWPACAFSFAHASQDPNVTRNLYELYYEGDLLMNELAANDPPDAWLVDLGDVALRSVPPNVDPSAFATGNWGKHDALQAYANHTYLQRIARADGAITIAAFRVVGLAPGDRLTIEWLRSTSTTGMVVPTACLP